MGMHRTEDNQPSSMERAAGKWLTQNTGHQPKHAAQETTPSDLPARGAGLPDNPTPRP